MFRNATSDVRMLGKKHHYIPIVPNDSISVAACTAIESVAAPIVILSPIIQAHATDTVLCKKK